MHQFKVHKILQGRFSSPFVVKTLKSIKDKSQVIYQGSLEGNEFTARPDFLVLNSDKRYDVVDAKFSKNSKEKYQRPNWGTL